MILFSANSASKWSVYS